MDYCELCDTELCEGETELYAEDSDKGSQFYGTVEIVWCDGCGWFKIKE